MKLWGKNRETVKVKKAAAARAIYNGPDVTLTEFEVKLVTEDGEKLTLMLTMDAAFHLTQDLTISYDAAVPRLRTGGYQSDWQGME